MAESLHPHENQGNLDNVTPIDDESINPAELERYALLEQFLSQCRHPSLKKGEEVSSFIVSTLQNDDEASWGYQISRLKVDVVSLSVQHTDQIKEQDEVFARIYDLITETKASVGRVEGIRVMRKALLELLDLRAGVLSQFDQASLMSERNEHGWRLMVEKVVAF